MGTVADKLTYLQETKEAIRKAIEAQGGTVAAGLPGGHPEGNRESGGHSARWAPLPSIREPDP